LRIAVLGAGNMGKGAAFDLVGSPQVEEVVVADINKGRVDDLAGWLNSPKAKPERADAHNPEEIIRLLEGCDAAISCLPYRFNLELAKCAIRAGTHLCDLGGNVDVVKKELALTEEAEEAGVTIIPDCGLAPGMVSILVALGVERLKEVYEVYIRVGGLPQNPQPPLNYMLLFSVSGLINEYIEPCLILRDGQITQVEPLTEVEEIRFPPPWGRLEAFQTSGGTSTLPLTYQGKISELDYKTIRYPGHCRIMKPMIDLGMASSEAVLVDGQKVIPRALLETLLLLHLPTSGPDVVLLQVTLCGERKGLSYQMIDLYDHQTGLSAMMRTTAFPASIIAQMLGSGRIRQKGVIPQELSVPPGDFWEELEKRGIRVEERWDGWTSRNIKKF
jgi:lysine 6-dehydrogenase